MKYFILQQDKDYTDAPFIVNWFGKINADNIRMGKYEMLKEVYSLTVRDNKELDTIDLITEPFMAVSAMVKYCIEAYEPNIGYSRLYLLDKSTERVEEYFIPYLIEEDCLSEQSILNQNKTIIEKPVLDEGKIGKDRYLFMIGGINSRYIVAREEFVESILRRGARGIRFIPVTLVEKGDY